ncbi:Rha family transcriptional regulator, partial [Glaesserella parasuis]|nr:Rha family transcriptional regulator [Glaesserella parasuis]MDO9766090.1 Rha family transcriptional regulator [Glaesserella parasuis]MDO9985228.1 Rha family transcriptional regulator [Glaesserella parasuis]MDP0369160.1 Rha family transcriptional regulator [Glaesserella parasuis]
MKTELLSTNQRENATLTMSSREIARITESRHRDVCLSIRNLMNKGVIGGYAESPYTHEQNGQVYYEYHINKRDTYVIVAQFSPEFTARLVDRWQELENQQKLPSNYLQALKALVESEEEKQTLLLENQTMKPKADFVDHYVEVGTSKSLRETAKILNFPEKMMI